MIFKESYSTAEIKEKISKDEKLTKVEKDKEVLKTTITNDAFAIGEMIQILINTIEQARLSSLRAK